MKVIYEIYFKRYELVKLLVNLLEGFLRVCGCFTKIYINLCSFFFRNLFNWVIRLNCGEVMKKVRF